MASSVTPSSRNGIGAMRASVVHLVPRLDEDRLLGGLPSVLLRSPPSCSSPRRPKMEDARLCTGPPSTQLCPTKWFPDRGKFHIASMPNRIHYARASGRQCGLQSRYSPTHRDEFPPEPRQSIIACMSVSCSSSLHGPLSTLSTQGRSYALRFRTQIPSGDGPVVKS